METLGNRGCCEERRRRPRAARRLSWSRPNRRACHWLLSRAVAATADPSDPDMASLHPTGKGGTRQPEPLEEDKSPRMPSLSVSLPAAAATASLSSSDSAGLVCAGSRCPAASCASDSYTNILFYSSHSCAPFPTAGRLRSDLLIYSPSRPPRDHLPDRFLSTRDQKTREELSKRGMLC